MSSQLIAGDSAAATIKRIELALQTASKCAPCVLFFNHVKPFAEEWTIRPESISGELPMQINGRRSRRQHRNEWHASIASTDASIGGQQWASDHRRGCVSTPSSQRTSFEPIQLHSVHTREADHVSDLDVGMAFIVDRSFQWRSVSDGSVSDFHTSL